MPYHGLFHFIFFISSSTREGIGIQQDRYIDDHTISPYPEIIVYLMVIYDCYIQIRKFRYYNMIFATKKDCQLFDFFFIRLLRLFHIAGISLLKKKEKKDLSFSKYRITDRELLFSLLFQG